MHVASRSVKVRGAITVGSLVEGTAVKLTDSGVVNGLADDLPFVAQADSGLNPVYILAAAPDDFPRPVDDRQYRAGWRVVSDRTSAADYAEPYETITRYNIGISNLDNPTIPSGYLVNLHKGGTYTVPLACYVDSATIRIPGTRIEVGSSGKWQYNAVGTKNVGEVVHWNSETQELTFELFI